MKEWIVEDEEDQLCYVYTWKWNTFCIITVCWYSVIEKHPYMGKTIILRKDFECENLIIFLLIQ